MGIVYIYFFGEGGSNGRRIKKRWRPSVLGGLFSNIWIPWYSMFYSIAMWKLVWKHLRLQCQSFGVLGIYSMLATTEYLHCWICWSRVSLFRICRSNSRGNSVLKRVVGERQCFVVIVVSFNYGFLILEMGFYATAKCHFTCVLRVCVKQNIIQQPGIFPDQHGHWWRFNFESSFLLKKKRGQIRQGIFVYQQFEAWGCYLHQIKWPSKLLRDNRNCERWWDGFRMDRFWDGWGDDIDETWHRMAYLYNIWVFPKIMVPQNGWFIMENPIKHGMIWGVFPLFLETPIYI